MKLSVIKCKKKNVVVVVLAEGGLKDNQDLQDMDSACAIICGSIVL